MTRRGYLQFDCGARSVTFNLNDAVDSFELFSLREQKRRKKDGRYNIVVFDTAGYRHQPHFEDGRRAPCLSCPCRRSSGRRQVDAMPEEGRTFRVVITCYPQEIYEPGQVSDASDSSPSATPDVAPAMPRVAECPTCGGDQYLQPCDTCGAGICGTVRNDQERASCFLHGDFEGMDCPKCTVRNDRAAQK